MSFSREIKDFLGAAQSTFKMMSDADYNKSRRALLQAQLDKLNDPLTRQQAEANLAQTRASTAATNMATNDPLRDEKARAEIDRLKSIGAYYRSRSAPQPQDEARASDYPGAANPVVTAPQTDLLNNVPTTALASGGMVQKFADGGIVDEDDDPNDEDDVATVMPPAIGPTDVSAQSRGVEKPSQEAAHDAVVAGLKYGAAQVGPANGIPTQLRQQRLRALSRGAGAAPLADMEAIYKKIDSQGRMSESERNMAALSTVYQWKMRIGDEHGAQRAAFQMLQRMNVDTQRYAALAAVAGQNGDLDGAAKAAAKAYANIPDGKDLKIIRTEKGLQYSLTDEKTGKTISQGIATPEQLGAAAMGVASKGFYEMLLSLAGQRAAKQGAIGGGGSKAPNETQKESALESIDKAYKTAFPDKEDKPKPGTDEERVIKSNAFRIYSANPKMTHDEAIDVTQRLLSPNKNSDEPGFVSKKLENGEGYSVKVGKNAPIRVSEEDFDAMAAYRVEKAARLKKATEKKDKPSLLGDIAGAVGNYASREGDAFMRQGAETLGRVKGAVGKVDDATGGALTEAYERGKSAVNAAGRAIGDIPVIRGMMNGPGEDKF